MRRPLGTVHLAGLQKSQDRVGAVEREPSASCPLKERQLLLFEPWRHIAGVADQKLSRRNALEIRIVSKTRTRTRSSSARSFQEPEPGKVDIVVFATSDQNAVHDIVVLRRHRSSDLSNGEPYTLCIRYFAGNDDPAIVIRFPTVYRLGELEKTRSNVRRASLLQRRKLRDSIESSRAGDAGLTIPTEDEILVPPDNRPR